MGDSNQQPPIKTEPSGEAGRSAALDLESPAAQLLFQQAVLLLEHYSFEIVGCSARAFVTYWADDLPIAWIRLAVLEALYLGRYKAVSVSQILALWERKGQPQPHFNAEFERLICHHLDETLSGLARQPKSVLQLSELKPDVILESEIVLSNSEFISSDISPIVPQNCANQQYLTLGNELSEQLSYGRESTECHQSENGQFRGAHHLINLGSNTGEQFQIQDANQVFQSTPMAQKEDENALGYHQVNAQILDQNSGSTQHTIGRREPSEKFDRSTHPAEIERFIPDADLSIELHDKLRGLAELPSLSDEPDTSV